ncbi:hypothetical protein MMC19_001948 [Ptychographa xylographoides]|nr:hypothetical protein [Ptychographa xylographoides]
MPTSLNESIATSQSPNSVTDTTSVNPHRTASPSHRDSPAPLSKNKVGITYAGQDSLPRLPIPDLESSCEKYLESLKPLQTPREHKDTINAVHEFLKRDGPILQERLKKYATGKSSYIEQFCASLLPRTYSVSGATLTTKSGVGYDSYLNFDNPVVLNLNPFFLLEDDPTPARNNQVTRAASLVISALSFVRAVRKEELPPDTIKGNPLCMYQYSRLFGTARVPTENGCQIGQDDGAKHLVVLGRGQFYWFDVLDDNSDLIMTEKDMAVNLQVIVDDAQQTPIQDAAKGALGVLSTENRKIWAGLREVLTRDDDSNNAECLSTVDSAIFILCLDYTEPQTPAELCGNMLCGSSEVVKGVQIGTCTNRWYDKLQIIVCKNGSAGINFEHTGVDGHTVLRMASDVYTDTILRFAKSINGHSPTLWSSTSPDPSKRDPRSFGDVSTTPHKLEWDMVPELSTALRFAETRLADLIQQNEFQTLDFEAYGKNFITSMGFSPDAFVQMAFQAAYYGLYGRVECTYEPAMTKMFLHGRTEAIRSVTAESVNFVQTFWAENPPAAKVNALTAATKKHTNNTRECSKAQGQDRHLYALYSVWQRALDEDGAEAASSNGFSSNGYSSPVDAGSIPGSPVGSPKRDSILSENPSVNGLPSCRPMPQPPQQMPSIFADSGWDKINNTILSTSNCGNPSLRQFGFGPTSGDGFGIGYIIKDDSISICASSKHRQTKRFVDAIEAYFLEIRRLLRMTQSKATSPKASRAREAERTDVGSRFKTKGRVIKAEGGTKDVEKKVEEEDEDDGLGGCMYPSLLFLVEIWISSWRDNLNWYNWLTTTLRIDGFFDAGMLLKAIEANEDEKSSEKAVAQGRKQVGKKLRLSEY